MVERYVRVVMVGGICEGGDGGEVCEGGDGGRGM